MKRYYCPKTAKKTTITINKQRASSCEVMCKFRLFLEKGRTSVKTNLKHCIFMRNYHCLYTGLPYNTAYV